MNRREIREQIFLLLFRKEFYEQQDMEEQLQLYRENREDPASEDDRPIKNKDVNSITEKCSKILLKLPEIDSMLAEKTEKWNLSRIGKTELTILRLAVYEILFDEGIPVGVAINEAVELSKKYCQDGAGAFINGILARFANSDPKTDTSQDPKADITPVLKADMDKNLKAEAEVDNES